MRIRVRGAGAGALRLLREARGGPGLLELRDEVRVARLLKVRVRVRGRVRVRARARVRLRVGVRAWG